MNRYERTIARAVSPAALGKAARRRVRALADAALSAPMKSTHDSGKAVSVAQDGERYDSPALKGTDISGIDVGEKVAIYERDSIVTGGEFFHVHPRDCIGLEDCR